MKSYNKATQKSEAEAMMKRKQMYQIKKNI